MSPEQWRRVRDLFEEALDLPQAERAAFLDRECGEDGFLRGEVESLLASHEEVGTRFERPMVDLLRQTESDTDSGPRPPRRLGPYEIDQPLGEGGMGVVYAARRVDGAFDRRVAVKILRQGLHGAEAVRRFEWERRILALLEHPNIARLMDGGSADDGRPYLVMEYVEGEPLLQYCDRRCLSIEDRLRLFIDICDAVQFAHQNLVIHRDLKPSNLLVTADGRPKLLDFGIAKILAPESDHTAWVTQTGLGPMTPDFASPEQIRGRPVTTATDVYSLGLVLYRLLCGVAPYEVDSRRLDEMVRVVCEEIPPAPSERRRDPAPYAVTSAETSAPGPAQERGLDPARLQRRLRGDLDAVVLQALAKDPEQRYGSPEALAKDLRRHLLGYPVGPRSADWTYRLGKMLSRRRRWVAAGLVAAIALSLLFAGILSQRRAMLQEQRLTAEVSQLMAEVFTLPDPDRSRGEQITARELLDRSAAVGASNLPDDSPMKARYLTLVGSTYAGLGLAKEAVDHLSRATELYRSADEPLLLADASSRLARALLKSGELEAARDACMESLDIRRRHLRSWPLRLAAPESRDRIDAAQTDDRIFLAELATRQDRPDDAERHLSRALDSAEARADMGQIIQIRRAQARLADVDAADGGPAAASTRILEDILQRALADVGEDHAGVADLLVDLAHAERHQDAQKAYQRFQRALRILRGLHDGDAPPLARALDELGRLHLELGHRRDAQVTLSEALAMKQRLFGPSHPAVAGTLCLLGRVAMSRNHAAATQPFRRAVDLLAAESHIAPQPVAECFDGLRRWIESGSPSEDPQTLPIIAKAVAILPQSTWPATTRQSHQALAEAHAQAHDDLDRRGAGDGLD